MSTASISFNRHVDRFLFDRHAFDKRLECVASGACGKLGRSSERENFAEQDFFPCIELYLNPPPGAWGEKR